MPVSNDPMQAALLAQMRNQNRRPSAQQRLAEQMMASLNNPGPIYGTGPAIARAGSGMMAGLMAALADRQDREREDQQLMQAQDRADKRSYLNDAAFNTAMGGTPQAPQMPQEAPSVPSGPMPNYGRNAGLVAQRDALLDAPPEQLVQASAQRSTAGGVPEIPGGYRANPGVDGAFTGAPAPTGRVMPLTAPGGAPTADMLRQRIEALTPLVGNDPRAAAAIQSAERELARIENQRIRQEDRQFMLASRPAPQPDELTRLFAAAGIQPGTPEAQTLARSMLERRGAPPTTNVNVDGRQAAGETTFDRERGKTLAEEERAVVSSRDVAGQTLRRLDQIDQASQRFTTGFASGARITAGQVAAQFGIPDEALRSLGISRDAIASAETIRSLQAQMLQGLIGPGGFPAANFSNADREMLERSLPGLQNSPGGNAAISAILRARAQRDLEIANSWNEYARTNGANYQTFDRWTRDVRPTIQSRDVLAPILESFQPPPPAPQQRPPGMVDRARARNAPAQGVPTLPPGFEVIQ